MSKELINFNLKAENEGVGNVFMHFVATYGSTINDFINKSYEDAGQTADASVSVVNGEIVVYQQAPDKGYVLGEVDNDEVPVQVVKYNTVAEGQRYITQQKDRLLLYIKTSEGKPDAVLGAFKTINDTIAGFNSAGVKTTMSAYADKVARETKAELKAEKRLAKLKPATTGE